MQIKTTLELERLKYKLLLIASADEDTRPGLSHSIGGNAKGTKAHSGKQFVSCLFS